MQKEKLYNILSIVCGVWFFFAGMMWVYWFALIFGYPFLLLGIFFWYKASQVNKSALNKTALGILIAGLVASIITLILVQ